MTGRRWLVLLVLTLVAGTSVGSLLGTGAAQGAAAAVSYTRTYTGTQFQPLDLRVRTQFMSGTGGGVYAQIVSQPGPSALFLELPLDLPVGATVTSVSFFYKDCGIPDVGSVQESARYYFGDYTPNANGYVDVLPQGAGGRGVCDHTYTYTRSSTSITTIAANRRYVLGANIFEQVVGTAPIDDPGWILTGARLQYTCVTATSCR
jgi:hypothetical protein